MILNIYVFRDKALSCYDKPLFEKDDKEQYAQGIARAIIKADEVTIQRVKDQALYYLGTFDDIHGVFNLLDKEEKLLDCEDYIPRKEDVKHAD